MTHLKPHLLVITSTFPENLDSAQPGFVLQLSTRLRKRFEVTVLAPDQPDTGDPEDFDGLRVIRFRYWIKHYQTLSGEGGITARLRQRPWRLLLIPLFVAAQILAIRRILKTGAVDLLHAHWILPQGACALLANRLVSRPVPVVTTAHGADVYALQWPGLSRVKCWVLRRSHAVAAVSRAMQADLGALAAPDSISMSVLPMGVDLSHRFTPPGEGQRDPRQILFVGRLVPKKGVHHLIAAMSTVARTVTRARLIVVGSGPEESRLRGLASQRGLGDQIRFFGAATSETVAELMQASGIVVVPSVTAPDGDQEGLGLVTIEAMGCACALVAHDFAAVHDVIVDGKTGLLVPQGDEPALAQALLRLLTVPELQQQLGVKGRQWVLEQFDWEPAADRYAKLFGKIIDDQQRAQSL
jgi:glycosyltransferase involved in cell wall biosynthesis